jgi:hypothetical protein
MLEAAGHTMELWEKPPKPDIDRHGPVPRLIDYTSMGLIMVGYSLC